MIEPRDLNYYLIGVILVLFFVILGIIAERIHVCRKKKSEVQVSAKKANRDREGEEDDLMDGFTSIELKPTTVNKK
ncbi:hypothetical protein DLEV_018 [Diachasmimorpha longicaudata entomopoxvirus]|uniref:Uncharacterized protein n=1 Tax=Diachasmimorpha longicaudata entomopoxvirus TaxID=109981 RepID=A0A7R5WLW2_9POXV|nr:hypothetical protein QKK69_gp018 [Diachasmimorpha longicaudata entomopoxvirus]AKS26309.1 hypothetical protein DLEV_018 [Diachasmimorpha longicaudata entomopoxvirus]